MSGKGGICEREEALGGGKGARSIGTRISAMRGRMKNCFFFIGRG